jgi:transcriptional regulator with XRE-family HTH domain
MTNHDDIVKPSNVDDYGGKSFLKTIRERLGVAEGRDGPISQQEFATRLGAGMATISRWERGVTPATFTISQMKNLAQILETINLRVQDLPDDLGPKQSAEAN